MILTELQLHSFRNHPDRNYSFHKGVNCVVGENGIGKTNLLDSINYLAFARTALNGTDAQSIRQDNKAFSIRGLFENDLTVACGYEFRNGKTLKVNGEEQAKIRDHVGKIPLVFTTPDDSDLIRDGSEYRRKFFDGAISQVNENYLTTLIDYHRILKQRNEHLKQNEQEAVHHKLLDSYDQQLIPRSIELSQQKVKFLKEFVPYFKSTYQSLHDKAEVPEIAFESDGTRDDFENRFSENRNRDIIMRRTLMGAHRDKFEFILDEKPIRKFGSQGQQKTFIISLRLAEYDYIMSKIGVPPLLLLDDIFDKLDDGRIKSLINVINDPDRFEQIFITDARRERSKTFFKDLAVNFIELK